ncbi:hypothetical protein [Amycolatopsis sp. FDAARGOS 1241]|uniref:hypothetical protein n=1 Tax=Amycolatopsis sp. FDAARGOS 1241 TaxID=2778070 RepID=UPI00194FDAF3|nr:hypothetical protein [Amycolatopsis sp. FDAARGOS 1241]QRP49597.1 hypothetical protein I6J71_18690 [Amycolatopsis sp. FDAARGOS 1241]
MDDGENIAQVSHVCRRDRPYRVGRRRWYRLALLGAVLGVVFGCAFLFTVPAVGQPAVNLTGDYQPVKVTSATGQYCPPALDGAQILVEGDDGRIPVQVTGTNITLTPLILRHGPAGDYPANYQFSGTLAPDNSFSATWADPDNSSTTERIDGQFAGAGSTVQLTGTLTTVGVFLRNGEPDCAQAFTASQQAAAQAPPPAAPPAATLDCDPGMLQAGQLTCAATVTNLAPNAQLTYQWSVDGQIQPALTGNPVTIPGLSVGEHLIGLLVTDTANNLSAVPQTSGPYTRQPLTAALTCDTSTLDPNGTATCTATVTNQAPNARLTYTWAYDDHDLTPASDNVASIQDNVLNLDNITVGDHSVRVEATDSTNNISTDPQAQPLTRVGGAVPPPAPPLGPPGPGPQAPGPPHPAAGKLPLIGGVLGALLALAGLTYVAMKGLRRRPAGVPASEGSYEDDRHHRDIECAKAHAIADRIGKLRSDIQQQERSAKDILQKGIADDRKFVEDQLDSQSWIESDVRAGWMLFYALDAVQMLGGKFGKMGTTALAWLTDDKLAEWATHAASRLFTEKTLEKYQEDREKQLDSLYGARLAKIDNEFTNSLKVIISQRKATISVLSKTYMELKRATIEVRDAEENMRRNLPRGENFTPCSLQDLPSLRDIISGKQ